MGLVSKTSYKEMRIQLKGLDANAYKPFALFLFDAKTEVFHSS